MRFCYGFRRFALYPQNLSPWDLHPEDFTDAFDQLRKDGSLSLDADQLTEINGGPLADGPHTLRIHASDAAGNDSLLFDLDFELIHLVQQPINLHIGQTR